MNGIHDMGGMHGFGKVQVDDDTVFGADWQRRAFALVETLAWAVPYSTDQHRYAIECLEPVNYLKHDYFENWIEATETLLIEAGLVDRSELEAGVKRFDINCENHAPVGPQTLVAATRAGAEMIFPADTSTAAFHVGQRVRVLNTHRQGHTRVPGYVRGKCGLIIRNGGIFQFADSLAAGNGPDPQHCYTVEFTSTTLWGDDGSQGDTICLDLWEPYLEAI